MYTYSHTCVILYSTSLWLSGSGLSGCRAISVSQPVWMTPRGAEVCVSLTHDAHWSLQHVAPQLPDTVKPFRTCVLHR